MQVFRHMATTRFHLLKKLSFDKVAAPLVRRGSAGVATRAPEWLATFLAGTGQVTADAVGHFEPPWRLRSISSAATAGRQ